MDGSGASDAAAAATDRPVSFVTKLPSRMRVNEGDAVELQVLLTGEPIESDRPTKCKVAECE
jgi:hypothetical protein